VDNPIHGNQMSDKLFYHHDIHKYSSITILTTFNQLNYRVGVKFLSDDSINVCKQKYETSNFLKAKKNNETYTAVFNSRWYLLLIKN